MNDNVMKMELSFLNQLGFGCETAVLKNTTVYFSSESRDSVATSEGGSKVHFPRSCLMLIQPMLICGIWEGFLSFLSSSTTGIIPQMLKATGTGEMRRNTYTVKK